MSWIKKFESCPCKCNYNNLFRKFLIIFELLCCIIGCIFISGYCIYMESLLNADQVYATVNQLNASPFMTSSCNDFVDEYKNLKCDYQTILQVGTTIMQQFTYIA